ncbi:DUF5806 family protein [Salinigranum sp.]|uniref:DUF5806 family protein n=1 Tax=Salinigranum sp. TaxID=1966351 RepID=UPI0035625647
MSDDPADDPRSRTGEEAETVERDERTEHGERDGDDGDDHAARSGASAGGPTTGGERGADGDETSATADGDAAETDGADAEFETSPDDENENGNEDEADAETGRNADGDAAVEDDRPPADVRKYERFKKVDGAQYDRVNDFLRERTYITAREWAIARLCADFRTETGVEMTKIGDNLPELVPFMTDTYSPQAVNQARHAFRDKVRKSGATFLYGAMCGFFTAEELDELMYEVSEIAKFLLEVEGVDLAVAEELEAEERISSVMREVREASSELRAEDLAEASDD